MYSQYGEEDIINSFFNSKKQGFFVDVGAADGEDNSNTRYLAKHLDWSGVLIEPHPEFYQSLSTLYKENNKIKTINAAVYNSEGNLPFYLFGEYRDAQISTLDEKFKQKVISIYGNKFKSVDIKTIKLQTIFKEIYNNGVNTIDFLSVDCEGADIEVLESNDWNIYRPSLICVEHSMDTVTLHDFMNKYNYTVYKKTTGNTFFVEKE